MLLPCRLTDSSTAAMLASTTSEAPHQNSPLTEIFHQKPHYERQVFSLVVRGKQDRVFVLAVRVLLRSIPAFHGDANTVITLTNAVQNLPPPPRLIRRQTATQHPVSDSQNKVQKMSFYKRET